MSRFKDKLVFAFVLFLRWGSYCVIQSGLKLLGSSDLLASDS
jgi:hypothetical protein